MRLGAYLLYYIHSYINSALCYHLALNPSLFLILLRSTPRDYDLSFCEHVDARFVLQGQL
jgi:hypothetical protein